MDHQHAQLIQIQLEPDITLNLLIALLQIKAVKMRGERQNHTQLLIQIGEIVTNSHTRVLC